MSISKSILCGMLLVACGGKLLAQDLDFPDYRSKKDNFSKIQDKPMRAEIASFALAAVDESIGKAPLASIPIKNYGGNFMEWEGPDNHKDNIHVTIRTKPFDPKPHKMMVVEKHLLRIDNHPYYGGNYGDVPKTAIESITVTVGADTVAIPKEAYSDLYDPKFSFSEGGETRTKDAVYVTGDKNGHTFYIYVLNPDNGGSEFTWVIQNKQYLRRVVDFGFLPK